MKKYLSLLLLWASLALVFSACSDDKETPNPEPEPTPERVEPTCWKMYDGDFLTLEDVVVSDDSTQINVNKAYLDLLTGDDDVKTGDVVAVFTHGLLNYFQVNQVAENGDVYMNFTVKEVSLTEVLGICNITMKDVKVSTEFWMDPSQPKRVNNSGEADENGLMNTQAYVEHCADGSTIYHPAAVLVPAFRDGMNAEEEGALIPGAYIGCYVGMSDNYDEANGFFSSVWTGIKNVGKAVITPVVTVATAVVDAAELLVKAAVGGTFDKKYDIISIDYEFLNWRWDILNRTRDRNESGEFSKPMYSKAEWKSKVKPKIYVTLDGHFETHAGFLIGLDFEPFTVKRFDVGAYANMDLELDAFIEAGVKAKGQRPITIKRFPSKELMVDIGPIPVLIVFYPEIVWDTRISADILGYAHMSAKAKFDYEAVAHMYPKFDAEIIKNRDPEFDFNVHQLGIAGKASFSTGPAFHCGLELYGLAGPVINVEVATFNAKCNADHYWDFDKEKTEKDIKAGVLLSYDLGKISIGGSIGFPPLKDISEYLYEKFAIDFDDVWEGYPLVHDTIYHYKEGPLPYGDDWDDENQY